MQPKSVKNQYMSSVPTILKSRAVNFIDLEKRIDGIMRDLHKDTSSFSLQV